MELKELPNEIIVKIFHHLSIEDLGSWTTVSKRFRHICLDRALPYGKMKNVFRKDMSTKELENSLAYKTRMIKKKKKKRRGGGEGGEVMAAGQKKIKMEIMGENGKSEEKRRKIA